MAQAEIRSKGSRTGTILWVSSGSLETMNREINTSAQPRTPNKYTAALALVALLTLAGCAGSPNFSGPQMNAPTLNQKNVSTGSGENSTGKPATGATPATSKAGTSPEEAALPPLEATVTPKGAFVAEPYLQLGDGKTPFILMWTTPDTPGTKSTWAVEVKAAGKGEWKKAGGAPTLRLLAPPNVAREQVYRAPVEGMPPGALFDYRVLKDGKPVFSARARAPKSAGQASRFAIFGDCGAGSPGQKKVAYQVGLAKPDMVFITGDIVYDFGRVSEYRTRFFPIYNALPATEKTGAPLLRSTLFVAATGNHDSTYTSLDRYPDGLAYFSYWDSPRNGPELTAKGRNTPPVRGNSTAEQALIAAAADSYPRAENFSFDYGDVHWLVLDSNYYVDWSEAALRAWVEKDLSSTKAPWKFVAFHIPPFHSSSQHQDDQFMRVLCDVFEKYSVDIVWAGHVHNYQRSRPMKFQAVRGPSGLWRDDKGRVAGQWTLDKTFDGVKNTKTSSPIYIVDGAGGAPLYEMEKGKKAETWQEFTAQYIGSYSFSLVEVNGTTLTLRQITDAGKEVDRITLTK